ncbi:hypothetical protein ACQP04_02205 [Pseudonocardia halophobica]|uniref:hypothetical protein n=1 Tax=Pseudonocardia halophobica TaxID=29401 RepID=UPI003D8A696D
MTVLSERPCATCGTRVSVTSRNPNRRFCSARCRAAHHRTQRPANAVTNAVTRSALTSPNAVKAVPDAVRNASPPANAVPAANGIQRCPHCHTELAVIAVVVPAEAAHIRTPEVTHMSPT